MQRYEALLLTIPEITKDETTKVESDLDTLTKKNKGAMISFERWGKYRLAYPVRKNDYGVYFLMRFEVDKDHNTALLDDMRSVFKLKLSDIVMREMVTRLDPDGSLAYQRPESLEETPHDVDAFLKANKMSGLIRGRRERGPRRAPAVDQEAVVKAKSVSEEAAGKPEATAEVKTEQVEVKKSDA